MSGTIKEGSLAIAQEQARLQRKEPLKQTQAFFNAALQGLGVSLDIHLPDPSTALQSDADRLSRRGALIFLSDGEPKQSLGKDSDSTTGLSNVGWAQSLA